MKPKPIYVEVPIQTNMESLWNASQDPKKHEQWDLRFSSITYKPRQKNAPQLFTYETNIGFGMKISGWGKSTGKAHSKDGSRTSALHFGTEQSISIIREGRGYWKYQPKGNSIDFITQYDYQANGGVIGKTLDSLVFRPLIGWATALSFDVLKRWLEKGETPGSQYLRFFSGWMITYLFLFIWLYHGLVPKIIHVHPEEIAMMTNLLPLSENMARILTAVIGIGEVIFGLCLLFIHKKRRLYGLQMIAFPMLAISAIVSNPEYLAHPFSPLTFHLTLFSLSLLGFWFHRDLPTAKSCRRKKKGC